MRRFFLPRVGDSVRIHPLIDAQAIQKLITQGQKTNYYCLPIWVYAAQSVQLYVTTELGKPNDLLGKLFDWIDTKDFSQYEITVSTIGTDIGQVYTNGVVKISCEKAPFKENVKIPTKKEMQDAINEFERERLEWYKGKGVKR